MIKRFLAIISDTILQTAENAITMMLDIIAQLLTGMMDILTATIDIPVLSWLYKQLTQEDLSFVDLLCLISAIPVTLIYKIATDKAPFPQGDAFTNGLINAKTFADIQAQFFLPQTASPMTVAATAGTAVRLGAARDVLDQTKLKVFAFATGICSVRWKHRTRICHECAKVHVGSDIPEDPRDSSLPKQCPVCFAEHPNFDQRSNRLVFAGEQRGDHREPPEGHGRYPCCNSE